MYFYEVIDDHIKILGCRGYDGFLKLPERIEGRVVTELAAYCFSDSPGRGGSLTENELCCCDEEGLPLKTGERELPPKLCGSQLKGLYLPKTIEKIGSYAFYNCYELEELECSSSISDLGAGLFTGCGGLRRLVIHVEEGKRSCMKELLSELRQELCVEYYSTRGYARLVFPEMFEESVENTPARIIMREMHGCGHRYRYCFDQSEFQFHKYDALFPHILVQEPERVVLELVLDRLFYPLDLYEQYRMEYEEYLREHFKGAASYTIRERRPEEVLLLAEQYADSEKELAFMTELAAGEAKTELVSGLTDIKRRRFPTKRKHFSL